MRQWMWVGLMCAAMTAGAQVEKHYDRTVDLVYLVQGGSDFYMDIFRPNGKPANPAYKPGEAGKGLAIVDVVSGGWSSDRGKLDDQETAQMFDIFTARGFTVFAARPGDRDGYIVPEMVGHIHHAIRWVKAHADEYGIDPERLGLVGASAGGHLTLMTLLTPGPGDPAAADPIARFDTSIKAAGVFFPPTNFLDWPGNTVDDIGTKLGDILFKGGAAGKTRDEIAEAGRKASPYLLLEGRALPPLIFFHGDADPLVPLQQSQIMVDAIRARGGEAELVVKPGGGHPWLTIPFEVMQLADWMAARLR